MDREAKRLAEQQIEAMGSRALSMPRDLIVDVLADKGLDHDEEAVEDFEGYIRWLWEE